mmetsp:Transcript_45642/g.99425  ORF Transcript_45642/g.99425 Transcript_45642/m.99425 type:complete len:157 (-) Transcript_45642:36-506(-)
MARNGHPRSRRILWAAAKSGTLTVAKGRESLRASLEAMPAMPAMPAASLAVTKETPEVAKTTAMEKAPEGNPMANGGRQMAARTASGPMVGTNGKMIGRKTGKMNGRMIGRQTIGKDRGRTLSETCLKGGEDSVAQGAKKSLSSCPNRSAAPPDPG